MESSKSKVNMKTRTHTKLRKSRAHMKHKKTPGLINEHLHGLGSPKEKEVPSEMELHPA
jgi:hypothetical protein